MTPRQRLKELDKRIDKLEDEQKAIIDKYHLCRHCYKKSDREVTECQECHDGLFAALG